MTQAIKKISILMPSEVPGFREHIDEVSLRESLGNFVDSLVPRINIHDLDDWKLTISVISQSKDRIGISKRIARFPSNRELGIYITIPIPNQEQASYGFGKPARPPFFQFVDEKYSYAIEPNFKAYVNLDDYYLASAKMAIELAFINGFTCNGKKIKLQPA